VPADDDDRQILRRVVFSEPLERVDAGAVGSFTSKIARSTGVSGDARMASA